MFSFLLRTKCTTDSWNLFKKTIRPTDICYKSIVFEPPKTGTRLLFFLVLFFFNGGENQSNAALVLACCCSIIILFCSFPFSRIINMVICSVSHVLKTITWLQSTSVPLRLNLHLQPSDNCTMTWKWDCFVTLVFCMCFQLNEFLIEWDDLMVLNAQAENYGFLKNEFSKWPNT